MDFGLANFYWTKIKQHLKILSFHLYTAPKTPQY